MCFRIIERCDDEGMGYCVKTLLPEPGYSFLFVLQRIRQVSTNKLEDHAVEDLEDLFGIRQFPEGRLQTERLFDIVDRVSNMLVSQWADWCYQEVFNLVFFYVSSFVPASYVHV